jgi:hypothetical protein
MSKTKKVNELKSDLYYASLHTAASAVACIRLEGTCLADVSLAGHTSDPMRRGLVVRGYHYIGRLTKRKQAIVELAGNISETVYNHTLVADGNFPTAPDLYDDISPNRFHPSSRKWIEGYLPKGVDDPELHNLLEEALGILAENWNLILAVSGRMRKLYRKQFHRTPPEEDSKLASMEVTPLIPELGEFQKSIALAKSAPRKARKTPPTKGSSKRTKPMENRTRAEQRGKKRKAA